MGRSPTKASPETQLFHPVPCVNIWRMDSKYLAEHINQAECPQWPSWPALLERGFQKIWRHLVMGVMESLSFESKDLQAGWFKSLKSFKLVGSKCFLRQTHVWVLPCNVFVIVFVRPDWVMNYHKGTGSLAADWKPHRFRCTPILDADPLHSAKRSVTLGFQ